MQKLIYKSFWRRFIIAIHERIRFTAILKREEVIISPVKVISIIDILVFVLTSILSEGTLKFIYPAYY
jgi:hypothetical protein